MTSLSRRLGVAKSTVYRLASTLVSEGLLEQNPETERYRLGMALFGLGALVRQRMNVATDARPFLFHLREATGETVHLAILEGPDIVYVLNLESNQAIRMRADLGARKPAFCTAEGRAMLAFQPPDIVNDAARPSAGAAHAEDRSSTRQQIWAALDDVRKRGFATEDEQSELGMRSVAAPIRNANGRVVAAIGLAGPMQRISDEALATFAPLVVDAATHDFRPARISIPSTGPNGLVARLPMDFSATARQARMKQITIDGRKYRAFPARTTTPSCARHCAPASGFLTSAMSAPAAIAASTSSRAKSSTSARIRRPRRSATGQRKRWLGCQANPHSDCTIKVTLRDHYKPHRPAEEDARARSSHSTTRRTTSGSSASLSEPVSSCPANTRCSACRASRARAPIRCATSPTMARSGISRSSGCRSGAATGALFDHIKVGDAIGVDGPYGMAYLREDAPRDILLLAGGSGLSPMISISRGMSPRARSSRAAICTSSMAVAPRATSAANHAARAAAASAPRLHYHPAISMPTRRARMGPGLTGFVHDIAAQHVRRQLAACEIYFAGPPAMGEAVQRMLVEKRRAADQVHFDQFY